MQGSVLRKNVVARHVVQVEHHASANPLQRDEHQEDPFRRHQRDGHQKGVAHDRKGAQQRAGVEEVESLDQVSEEHSTQEIGNQRKHHCEGDEGIVFDEEDSQVLDVEEEVKRHRSSHRTNQKQPGELPRVKISFDLVLNELLSEAVVF